MKDLGFVDNNSSSFLVRKAIRDVARVEGVRMDRALARDLDRYPGLYHGYHDATFFVYSSL
jgi:hypothetical protein